MSDLVLTYLVELLTGLAIPLFMLIIASWRVARLRNLTQETYKEKVTESISDTIKEQISERVINPLFHANNIVLPPGTTSYDILDTLVPGDDIAILNSIYVDLSQFGADSTTYQLLLQIIRNLGGGG